MDSRYANVIVTRFYVSACKDREPIVTRSMRGVDKSHQATIRGFPSELATTFVLLEMVDRSSSNETMSGVKPNSHIGLV